MSIEQIWIIVLAISTPIAGVVGFVLQLRNIKKARLQNEKLKLEIKKLKQEAELQQERLILQIEKLRHENSQANSRVVVPTREEVGHFVPQYASLWDDDKTILPSSHFNKKSKSHSFVLVLILIGIVGCGLALLTVYFRNFFS